jgi:hypothetical protein
MVRRAALGIGVLLSGSILLVAVMSVVRPHLYLCDWEGMFYPAGQQWRAPYAVRGFFNPPWLAWIVYPFSVFGPWYSYVLWVLCTVPLALWSVKRIGVPFLSALLCLVTPYYWLVFYTGNIDVLALAGWALLDALPVVGTLLLVIKPHTGGALLLTARYRVYPDAVVAAAVLGAAFWLNGNWPWAMFHAIWYAGPQAQPHNGSLFPYGLCLGFPLLVVGYRRRDRALLAAAMPFMSPYVTGDTFFVALPAVLARQGAISQVGLIAAAWALVRLLPDVLWPGGLKLTLGGAVNASGYLIVGVVAMRELVGRPNR